MKADRRSIPNVDQNDVVKDRERRQEFPDERKRELDREQPRHRPPDKPAPEIENTDPNAAENQGEPGQENLLPTPHKRGLRRDEES
jgi:hypothetical protein